MGMAAILVMWPGLFEQLSFSYLKEAPHKIWLQSAKKFENIESEWFWTKVNEWLWYS